MSLTGEGRLAPGQLLKKRSGTSFIGKLSGGTQLDSRCSCLLCIEGQAKNYMRSKSHFSCQNQDQSGTKVICWSPCTEGELEFPGSSGILLVLSLSAIIHIKPIHAHLHDYAQNYTQFRMALCWVCWHLTVILSAVRIPSD